MTVVTKQYRCDTCGTYYTDDEVANMSKQHPNTCHCDGHIKLTNKIIRVDE